MVGAHKVGASEPPALGQVGRGRSARWWGRAVGVYSVVRGRGRFGDFIHVHETPIVFGTVRCWVGAFRGLIPKVRWCRSRERGGTCPHSLAQQKDLGKGVWSVRLGCRRASSFYFSAGSVDSRARLEAHLAVASPGAWGLLWSKPRLSPGLPRPGLWEQLTPTDREPLWAPPPSSGSQGGPGAISSVCRLCPQSLGQRQQPPGGEAATKGPDTWRDLSFHEWWPLQKCVRTALCSGVRRERGSDAVSGELGPVETHTPGQTRVRLSSVRTPPLGARPSLAPPPPSDWPSSACSQTGALLSSPCGWPAMMLGEWAHRLTHLPFGHARGLSSFALGAPPLASPRLLTLCEP